MKRSPCLLMLALLALAPAAQATDLLVDNVNGYTLDSHGKLQHFQALLVEQGKVVATGSHAELAGRAGDAKVIDGHGRTLLPGLIDAHGHVLDLGYARNSVDLTGTQSLQEALAKVKAYAAAHPDAKWILGGGWNQEIWKLGRFPTAKELDAVVSDRPVWLSRVDGHAAWANSAAIKLAGVDAATKDPSGGRIERDASGGPAGVFVDGATDLVNDKVPAPTAQERAAALDAALAEMASVGLTGVGDAGIDLDTYRLYRDYADAHKLTARIYAMIRNTGAAFDTISQDGPLIGYGGDFLTMRAVKLFADGALGSRGAAMLKPYSDDPHNRGLLFMPPAAMTAKIDKAFAKGYQVAIHAIGDGANREVLDSFATAYKTHPAAIALRNRVEHAQILSLQDIPRFVPLKLIASMQPTHATSDMNMAEDRIGHQRIAGAYAWQRFLKQGTVIAGGSDFPVESPNPFYGLYSAVTREDHDGQPPGGWYPQQDMTLVQALRAFTLDAAYAEHAEHTLGTLEPGKWADFILIDHDIFRDPASRIWNTKVLQTWVGGRQVYAAKD
ncbi:amidohydrolase [Rhodanobacter denitrificans]|uniref:amidohydrolase n=1 Tax=Rhodanobacter denitrificans TaxID=666685 RepID=UPI000260DD86|nr:amidohydrolase [Rhodanobacter denitrificans]EIM03413.1 metal-dependent amidohydrolase with the TIM-barrel fold protein [Rhodanobacter denitrificans]UJM89133.1 amidohydrolase [Rhodanobacter denitrificans]